MSSTKKVVAGLHFILTETLSPEDRSWVHEQIKAFNNRVSRHHRAIRPVGPRPLDILLRDDKEKVVGGLIASTYWGWLDIDDLWVTEHLRRQGLGHTLLRMAEEEARERGCSRAKLRTFSFQARGFYEKTGYRVVGQLEDYPPGATFYWMRKDW
jgi:ribosomal protein S18 acetylase RimI-like enzyme